MAHNLYENSMAFTGAKPWHSLGTSFDGAFTAEQAIDAAHLGFVVTKEPVYRMICGEPAQVPHRFVTVNNDNQEILGMVGDQYEVLQNREAFGFFDELLSETGATYQTAGALGKGERIWLMAKLPESFDILMGDQVDQFCLLSAGHDGNSSVDVRFTPIRVVCQNTLTAALDGSRETVSIRHTESCKSRLSQAAIILKEMRAHFAALGEVFQELASVRIDDAWIAAYEEKLFGPMPQQDAHGITKNLWQKKMTAYEAKLDHGMGVWIPGVKETAWGAYNAAIEFADYEFPIRDEEKRTESILWGRANAFKQTAFDVALVLARR